MEGRTGGEVEALSRVLLQTSLVMRYVPHDLRTVLKFCDGFCTSTDVPLCDDVVAVTGVSWGVSGGFCLYFTSTNVPLTTVSSLR
jgi:hypothetical protein